MPIVASLTKREISILLEIPIKNIRSALVNSTKNLRKINSYWLEIYDNRDLVSKNVKKIKMSSSAGSRYIDLIFSEGDDNVNS